MKNYTQLINAEMHHIAESITFLQSLRLLVKTYIYQFKNRHKQDYRNRFTLLFLAISEENERLKQTKKAEQYQRSVDAKKHIDHIQEMLEG